MDKFREQLLRSIDKHNGKWTWFQLDRAINAAELPNGTTLMSLLKELKTAGLIEEGPGPNSSQPNYFITADGVAHLRAVDAVTGPED